MHRRLGPRVRRHVGPGLVRGDGAHVEDVAAFARQHVAESGAARDERAEHVGLEDRAPFLDPAVLDQTHDTGAGDVDERVDTPVTGHGAVDQRSDLLLVAHVGDAGLGDAAARISSQSAASRSPRRAPATTVAPVAASARAVAAPMPDDAPVTTATRPANARSSLTRRPPAARRRRGRAESPRPPASTGRASPTAPSRARARGRRPRARAPDERRARRPPA